MISHLIFEECKNRSNQLFGGAVFGRCKNLTVFASDHSHSLKLFETFEKIIQKMTTQTFE